MNDNRSSKSQLTEEQNGFEVFFEILGWLRIVASPLLIGTIIGALVYFRDPTRATLIIAIIVIVVGLLIGIIGATKKWRREGTMHFISRVSATPELDHPVMTSLELIPVIELPTRNWDDAGPLPAYPISTHIDEWESYWRKLQNVTGYKNIYKTISPGIPFYRVNQFVDTDDLALIVKLHLHPGNDSEEVPIKDSSPLFGGYVLRMDNEFKLYPQCCCDLGDFITWTAISNAKAEKTYLFALSGGHPTPVVTEKDSQLVFSCQDEDDSFYPTTDKTIVVNTKQLKLALNETSIELSSFANRLDKISSSYNMNKISDDLISMA